MNWDSKRVLVTGGCSFIGSHLVEELLARGASVRVADDLSTGRLENLGPYRSEVDFVECDLFRPGTPAEVTKGVDVVFHLAAIHGGRGFIDLHQSQCASNLVLDGSVIAAAVEKGVESFVFASSACVYPVDLQADVGNTVRLAESMVGPPFHADGIYGAAKLMAEQTLSALAHERGFPSVSCRLFTVYGERCPATHALTALVGRAVARHNPFEIWGDGSQVRNWTYVKDIVRGLVLAAENVRDGSAINLGAETGISVLEAVHTILDLTGHETEIKPLLDMPVGPVNRVADSGRARELLGWQATTPFREGLARLIAWYEAAYAAVDAEEFERRLIER